MEQLIERLSRLPIIPILFFWCLYQGYQYYSFMSDADSPLQIAKTQKTAVIAENDKQKAKIREVAIFLQNLEATRVEMRNLAQKLDSFKVTITETMNQADVISTLSTEASRVGLITQGVSPAEISQKEFYAEHPFQFKARGAFAQIIFFIDRLSNLQKVIRIDEFEIKPLSSDRAAIVELEAFFKITAFRYLGSKADEVANQLQAKTGDAQ